MPWTTTCQTCGKLYQERSRDEADKPYGRECVECYRARREAEKEAQNA